jgi:hypothetical protein
LGNRRFEQKSSESGFTGFSGKTGFCFDSAFSGNPVDPDFDNCVLGKNRLKRIRRSQSWFRQKHPKRNRSIQASFFSGVKTRPSSERKQQILPQRWC